MTWRSNNNRDRTVIDGITWLPRGPSSDSSCVEELYGNKGPTGPTGPTGVKTFVIEHPLNINKYLVHACLEGPEAGVYYRGTAIINSDCRSVDIYLANYVEHIANDFTIYATPMLMPNEGISFPNGISFPKLITSPIVNGKFTVYSDIVPCKFNYIVFGKRQEIDVEPYKRLSDVKGEGPYKWI
jgi:hypothetical protein